MIFGKKQTLLSGVQPTGRPHIGNYFGSIKQWVDLIESGKYESFFFIADYHALNFIKKGSEMRQNILDLAIDYLAIGLDPKKATIFKQSDVSAHTELAWIFGTITTMPYLMRAHAFKDAEAKGKEVGVGTFTYPMLMASDILLYDADIVPVGQDQKQHIEIARDTAQKFNSTFCDESNPVFKVPEAMIMENVATVPGIDGRKMSKSYGNTIPLFSNREEIQSSVMSIVTDSSAGIPENVYNIHKLFRSESELKKIYDENAGKYKALKEILIEDIDSLIKPLRERRVEIADDIGRVEKILEEGAKKAQEKALAKISLVKKAIGVE
jgi:tryptophanyl-tRNA synthetase